MSRTQKISASIIRSTPSIILSNFKSFYNSPEDDYQSEYYLLMEELEEDNFSWERSNEEGWYYDDE